MKPFTVSLRRIFVALFVAAILLGFVPGLSDALVLARPLFGTVTNGGFETGNFTGWTVNNSYIALPGDTGSGITTSATVQSSTKYAGTYAARLYIYGYTNACGTAHGPQITSDYFSASAGDSVAFYWYAVDSGDDYDVYGYVDNVALGRTETLFYDRGDNTGGWVPLNGSISSYICPSGTCTQLQFRFLGGTQDATCGTVVGSTLYIDGIFINDAPTISQGSSTSVTMSEDSSPTPFSLTLSASDPNGHTISWSIQSQAGHGTASASGTGTSKAIGYTPSANYYGSDSFVVRASDGYGGYDDITVNVTIQSVNDAPVANAGGPYSGNEGSSIALNGSGSSDVEGAITLYEWDCTADGVYDVSSASPTGNSCSYPDNGSYTVRLRVTDASSATDTDTASVTINNVAPDLAVSGATTIDEGANYTLSLSAVTDPGADTLSSCTVTWGDGASESCLGALGGSLAHTYADGPNGYTIAVRLVDEDGTYNSVDTQGVTVNNVAPKVTLSGDASVDEGAGYSLELSAVTDPGADTLSSCTVTWGDGTSESCLGALGGSLTHTYADGPNSYTVTLDLGDDDGSYDDVDTLGVTVDNVAPVAVDDTYSVDEDEVLSVSMASGVLDNDSDNGDDTLTAVLDSDPAAGTLALASDGSFVYTPLVNFYGAVSFTYHAQDSDGEDSNVATVTITVAAVNDAPSFTAGEDESLAEDSGAQTVAGWASGMSAGPANESGQVLTFELTAGNPALFSVQPAVDASTGDLTYTPADDAFGSTVVTVTLEDDGGTSNGGVDAATDTFQISISNVQDVPFAIEDEHFEIDEDSTDNLLDVLANDYDVDNQWGVLLDTLSIMAVQDVTEGTYTYSTDIISYTPYADFFGTEVFIYTIDDGHLQFDTAFVTVTVRNVNDPPVAAGDVYTISEDSPDNVLDVLANDSFAPDVGETLTVSDVGALDQGGVVVNNGSDLTYTPAADFYGTEIFTYTVNDGNGGTDVETVTVHVTAVNDVPDAADDGYNTNEDTTLTISAQAGVLANDSDVESDPLTATLVSGPAVGTLDFDSDGAFVYTPTSDFNGEVTFTYSVGDGNGGSASATVTIDVNAVNDPPVVMDDTASTDEDVPVSIPVLGNDSDGDGNLVPALVTVVAGPSFGGTEVAASGAITYSPGLDWSGEDVFSYQVCDDGTPGSECATGIVTVTVALVNDVPEFTSGAISAATEDVPYTYAITAEDVDAGGVLTITGSIPDWLALVDGGDGTATLSGTPGNDEVGDHPVALLVTDTEGATDTQEFTISVINVNDAPEFTSVPISAATEDVVYTYDITTVDVDAGDVLTITGTIPSWLTLVDHGNGTATLSGTPENGDVGGHAVTLQVEDAAGATDTQAFTITVANVNDAPVADDDTFIVSEDSSDNTLDVLNGDVDVDDGDTLSIVTVGPTDNGGSAISDGAVVTYTPASDFFGTEVFTYTVSDSNDAIDTATVTVTVENVNDAPVAHADAFTLPEDSSNNVLDVLLNDSILPDAGETLTVRAVGPTDHGGVVVNGGTSLSYTPASDFFGTEVFTYTISDGNGGTAAAVVTITVENVNDAPVADADTFTVQEDSSDNTLDVLDGDGILPDVGETLAIVAVGSTDNGGIVVNNGASLSYTPASDFFGTEVFTYTVSDGNGGTDTAVVTITVENVNDDPVANNDTFTVSEDSSNNVLDVLANDSILPDAGETLAIVVVGSTDQSGMVTNNGVSLSYTPAGDFFGNEVFTYTVSDGNEGRETATVSVTVSGVDDKPIANADIYYIDENSGEHTFSVLDNDEDLDGDPLVVQAVGNPANGTTDHNGQAVSYTPSADFYGTDTFVYTIDDGVGNAQMRFDAALVTVIVNAVPDVTDDVASVDEDTADNTLDVLANDQDLDGEVLTIVAVGPTDHNGVVVNNGMDLSYTPAGDFFGMEVFTYTVSDPHGAETTGMVTVTVNDVNDDPVANNDTFTVSEDSSANVLDVLANDSILPDVGETLTIVAVGSTDHGGIVVNNGSNLSYTPAGDFFGTEVFTATVSDGRGGTDIASVTITVDNVNDDPVAADDTGTTSEDTQVVVDVLANDSILPDAGETLSVVEVGATDHGGSVANNGNDLTYTPALNFYGTEVFTYSIGDGNGGTDTATVTMTVTAVNDAPVADDEALAVSEDSIENRLYVLVGDTDVDLDILSISAVGEPDRGGMVRNGSTVVTYTPVADFFGTETFTYTVSDGHGGSDTASVVVTVENVNDAPVAVTDIFTVTEDSTGNILDVLLNDYDVDLEIPVVAAAGTTGISGTVTNHITHLAYTPLANFFGTETFDYLIRDGDYAYSNASITVVVLPVNDAPQAGDDSYNVAEDTTLSVAAPGVLGDDVDVEGEIITATVETVPANGSLTLNADGSFEFVPALNYAGIVTFTYTARDGRDSSNIAVVTIDVGGVNDAPVATDDGYATTEDAPLTVAIGDGVLVNDSDADLDGLTAVLDLAPSQGGLALNPDGAFVYTPPADWNGVTTFRYHATDGVEESNSATVTITVGAVNDIPTFDRMPSTNATEDVAYQYDIVVSDVEDAGEALTITGPVTPGWLTLTDAGNGTGRLAGTPENSDVGDHLVTLQVEDSQGASATQAFTITVINTNDAPTASDDEYTMAEDTALTAPAPGVLGNDDDVDGDALTAVLEAAPATGTLQLNADGSFAYTPVADYNGVVTFRYHAADGIVESESATVTITVGSVNDAPDAVNDSFIVEENSVGNQLTVLGNDSILPDAGETLTIVAVGPTDNGGTVSTDGASLSYTPAAEFYGTEVFTYTVSDGELMDTATVEVTVTEVVFRVYVPLVLSNYATAPDLVVDSVTATTGGVQVVIGNQGYAAAKDFWVDVYINPDTAPISVNQLWSDLGQNGLAWGVTEMLQPGEVITLTVGDLFYSTEWSNMSWPLAAGTPVYAQVDSARSDTGYGSVLEIHEIIGSAYDNNIRNTISTSAP